MDEVGAPEDRKDAKRITLKDLAEQLNVSPMSVSLALNQRPGVSDALRQRVLEAASKAGYQPNFAARALRTEQSNILGLVNRNLRNPGFLAIVEGFTREAEASGYQVLLGESSFDASNEAKLVETLAAHRVDGLAISPLDAPNALRRWHERSPNPVVLVNATHDAGAEGVSSIKADEQLAIQLAVTHLLDLGHKNIAMLTSRALRAPIRRKHFEQTLRRNGREGSIIEVGGPDETRVKLAEILTADERPSALITDSDAVAHEVYFLTRELGLEIPRDLSIVGHDDLATSKLLHPALTTVAVDRAEIGRRAAQMLIRMRNAGVAFERSAEVVTVPVELVVRASTGVPQ